MSGMDEKENYFCWKQQKQFLCPLHCDHCCDYEHLSPVKTLMCSALDGRGRTGAQDLWCQIAHPHYQYVLSSEYLNVSCRLCLLLQHSLKSEWQFWDVSMQPWTLAEHCNWTDMIRGADGEVNFVVCVLQGQPGSRGEPGSPGERGPSGESITGPPVWTSIPASVTSSSFRLFVYTSWKMKFSLFAGASRKNRGTWICGKCFLNNLTLNLITSIKMSSNNIWLSVFQGLRGPPGVAGPQGPAGHNVSPK